MKRLYTLIIAIAIGFNALGQTDTTKIEVIEIEINGKTIEIDADQLNGKDLDEVIAEISQKSAQIIEKQKALTAKVNEAEAYGELTEEQAEALRDQIDNQTEQSLEIIAQIIEEWGEDYESRWDVWADSYESQMEKYETEMEIWEEQAAIAAEKQEVLPPLPPLPPLPDLPESSQKITTKKNRIIISENGVEIVPGENNQEPFAFEWNEDDGNNVEKDWNNLNVDRTNFYGDFHFGFNTTLDQGSIISDNPAELDWWRSNYWEFGLGGKTRLGSPYSKFYIKYGGHFSWNRFVLKGANILEKTPGGTIIRLDTVNNIQKSKYRVVYLDVPVMFQMDFSGVDSHDEAITLGIGGYVGIRWTFDRQLDYTDFESERVREKQKNEYNSNLFRYGLMAQIGFGAFKITGKYDINTLFREGSNPVYNVASIGIGFSY